MGKEQQNFTTNNLNPLQNFIFDNNFSSFNKLNSPSSPIDYSSSSFSESSYNHSTPQNFHFIDQTNQHIYPKSPTKRRRGPPVDLDKSRIAQQRRRDTRGKFLRNDVAARLEDLENKLKYQESECSKLRKSIQDRDVQLNILKEQLHQLMNQPPPPQYNYAYLPQQPLYPLQTTSRNYFLVPTPNPLSFESREAFKQKIDYSKIQLRKTDSTLDEEKKEVVNSQEEWAYRQAQQQFIRKLQNQAQWEAYQLQQPQRNTNSLYGGAPSNIYPETLNKVGNLPVSAFTTKVNLEDKRQKLVKTSKAENSAEKLLTDEQREELIRLFKAKLKQLENQQSPQTSPMNISPNISLCTPSPNIHQTIISQTPTLTQQDLSSDWNFDKQNESFSINDNSPISPRSLGGPPSNIYPPPEKIGNLQVPAFTTKIDYSEIELKKTE